MVSQWEGGKEHLFLTKSTGVMPPTTSSLQVRPIIGLSHLNSPHHLTGCYIHMGNLKKAQELLDACPTLMERRKLGATKYLPTETLILRKRRSILSSINLHSEFFGMCRWYSGVL